MNLENLKIKTLLHFSRFIPKRLKKDIKKELISFYSIKGLESRRDLFYSGMLHRIYDLYTTSILALIYRNSISLSCLLRAQLENLSLISYLKENPSKLGRIFQKTDFTDSQKQLKKIDPELAKYYGMMAQRSHPYHEGLKSPFDDVEQLVPKEGSDNSIDLRNKKSFTPEEFSKTFDRIPSIGVDAVPYQSIDEKEVPIAAQNVLDFYKLAKKHLEILYNALPEDKLENYKEVWKKHHKNQDPKSL